MFEVFYNQFGKYNVHSIRDNDGFDPDFLIYINNHWEWVSSIFCTPIQVDNNKRLTREEYTEKYCKNCNSLCSGLSDDWASGCTHLEELKQER